MKRFRFFRMSALVLLCSLLFVPRANVYAGEVDFSGKWTLNESKSDLGEGRFFAASKISITQDGKSITLERTREGRDGEERTSSETITMDGKKSITESGNRIITSSASWSDDKSTLTIQSDIEFNRQGEIIEIARTEVLTLSAEGKILTIQSEMSSPRGDRSVSLVYDKE